MKNEFKTLFFKYVLKGIFPFGILDAIFELTLTKLTLFEVTITQRWAFCL